MHPPVGVALRHLLVDDPAARGHPLDVARRDAAAVPHAVAVLDRAGEDVGDRLDPAVRMPGEAGQVVLGAFVAEVVEEEERVEVGGRAEAERPAQVHARAFEGGLCLDEALDGSDRHGPSFRYFPCVAVFTGSRVAIVPSPARFASYKRVSVSDHVMPSGARRDLRRVCHRQHLHVRAEPRQPHSDGIGHRAANPGVDFVEHQRRRRTAIGQHDLQRQQEPRQFAAGGDLHQRPRLGARVGLHPELDAVDAVRPGRGGIADDLGRELGALQLQWLQLGVDRLVEAGGGLGARLGQGLGALAEIGLGLGGGGEQRLEPGLAGIDQRDVVIVLRRQRRQIVHRDGVFAARRAQREKPLLVAFEFGRVEIGRAQRLFEMRRGFPPAH